MGVSYYQSDINRTEPFGSINIGLDLCVNSKAESIAVGTCPVPSSPSRRTIASRALQCKAPGRINAISTDRHAMWSHLRMKTSSGPTLGKTADIQSSRHGKSGFRRYQYGRDEQQPKNNSPLQSFERRVSRRRPPIPGLLRELPLPLLCRVAIVVPKEES
jgi:hypothetical protein